MSTFIQGDLGRGRAQYLLTMQDACSRSMAESWPFPRWIKIQLDDDIIPIMVWLNKAYTEWYGVNGYSYIGHCDRAVWDDATASMFAENDRQCIANPGQVFEFIEPTPRCGKVSHRVRKLAFRVETEQVKGWAIYGECTPD